jgi:hypothetical protein
MIVVLVPGGDWYVGLVSFSEVVAQPTSRVRTKHSTATLETVRKPLIGSIGLISSPVISQRNSRANNLAQKSEIGQNGLTRVHAEMTCCHSERSEESPAKQRNTRFFVVRRRQDSSE